MSNLCSTMLISLVCFIQPVPVIVFNMQEPAHRRGKHTKTIDVKSDTIQSYLISEVLPAIVAKWPQEGRGNTIRIQEDNVPSHVPVNDPQFDVVVAQTGLVIRLMNQPPNSHYMNCLGLGFFASLQALAEKGSPKTRMS